MVVGYSFGGPQNRLAVGLTKILKTGAIKCISYSPGDYHISFAGDFSGKCPWKKNVGIPKCCLKLWHP